MNRGVSVGGIAAREVWGKPLLSESSIGMALATRSLMDHLRSTGETTSGPKAFGPRDHSNFLSALDNAVARLKRGR